VRPSGAVVFDVAFVVVFIVVFVFLGLGWGGVDVVRIVVVAYIHSSMKGGKDGERGWWID
jgi:hypothetical protein